MNSLLKDCTDYSSLLYRDLSLKTQLEFRSHGVRTVRSRSRGPVGHHGCNVNVIPQAPDPGSVSLSLTGDYTLLYSKYREKFFLHRLQ